MSLSSISPNTVRRFLLAASVAAIVALPTIQARAQLHQAWTDRWDGSLSGDDGAYAMTVDSNGNIVVAGETETATGGGDGLVVKYDPSGRKLWQQTYDGPANAYEYWNEIETDSSDRIVVLGQSDGGASSWDFVTLVYDADGTFLWEQRYDGLGNGYDLALAMDLDGLDNIYVVGIEEGTDGLEEFTTIKYLPDGTEAWVRRYESSAYPPNERAWGEGVAVTAAGTVYAAGDAINASGGLDYALLKYDTDGNLLWERLFDGTYGGGDAFRDIALGPNEEIYLCGITETGTGFEYGVAQYDSAGTFQWEGRWGGATGYHFGEHLAVDQVGNAFVAGKSTNTAGYFDWVTVCFDINGTQQWAHRYQPYYYFGDNTPHGITVDGLGGVYVGGNIWNWHYEGHNAVLVKYDTAGAIQWTDAIDGPAGGDDAWFAVTVDGSNQVNVAGVSLGSGSGLDLLLAKYRQNGPPTLQISPMPLVPGQPGTFTVSNVEPGATTYLAYSTAGPGTVHVGFLDVTLGLTAPKQALPAKAADAAGTAQWTVTVPGAVSGNDLWFQGVQYHVATDVAATSVQ